MDSVFLCTVCTVLTCKYLYGIVDEDGQVVGLSGPGDGGERGGAPGGGEHPQNAGEQGEQEEQREHPKHVLSGLSPSLYQCTSS